MRITLESFQDALQVSGLEHYVVAGHEWLHYVESLREQACKPVWVLYTWHDTFSDNNGHQLGRIVCDANDATTIRSEFICGYGTDDRQPHENIADVYTKAAYKFAEISIVHDRKMKR